MTTVVGILNKAGVALAADSAATVIGGLGVKTYNHALKIFTLSKYHPVGVAIYNALDFYGIPWETIIKEYRKQLGDRSFDKLVEYKDDFFSWLKACRYFEEDWTRDELLVDFTLFFNQVVQVANQTPNLKSRTELITAVKALLNEQKAIPSESFGELESFHDINIESARAQLFDNKDSLIQYENIHEDLFDLAVDGYLARLKSPIEEYNFFTGVVFTGFGNKEMLPRLVSTLVSIVVDGNLKHHEDDDGLLAISNEQPTIVKPFAQTDVVQTILGGISPNLLTVASKTVENVFQSFLDRVSSLEGMPEQAIAVLNGMSANDFAETFDNSFQNHIHQEHVLPLSHALTQLSKEDLAEMAESLVYLTYLKRRITFAQETVGGPVDIAMITKGDGFVWIKRKHYFDANLNQSYLQKYLYAFEHEKSSKS